MSATEPASNRPPRNAGPVHRAFALLQTVVSAEGPVGVRELSRRTGLARSTVARQLATLGELGMVSRTDDGAALPGPAVATLNPNESRIALPLERLRPLLFDLTTEFGEAAALGIDDTDGFLYVSSERGPSAVQVPDPVGQRYPFHLVAPGLVAMAHWSPARLQAYMATELQTATVHSVTAPAKIRARCRQIRTDGFAWTNQELDLEVNGLAAPIIERSGSLIAVASLFGPAFRLAPERDPGRDLAFRAFVAERTVNLLPDS